MPSPVITNFNGYSNKTTTTTLTATLTPTRNLVVGQHVYAVLTINPASGAVSFVNNGTATFTAFTLHEITNGSGTSGARLVFGYARVTGAGTWTGTTATFPSNAAQSMQIGIVDGASATDPIQPVGGVAITTTPSGVANVNAYLGGEYTAMACTAVEAPNQTARQTPVVTSNSGTWTEGYVPSFFEGTTGSGAASNVAMGVAWWTATATADGQVGVEFVTGGSQAHARAVILWQSVPAGAGNHAGAVALNAPATLTSDSTVSAVGAAGLTAPVALAVSPTGVTPAATALLAPVSLLSDAAVSTPAVPQVKGPDLDGVLVGTWTAENARTTNLYLSVDEASPGSTADYVESPTNPAGTEFYRCRFTQFAPPMVRTGHVVRYRHGKTALSGRSLVMTVQVREGTDTVIAQRSFSTAEMETLDRTDTITLTEGEASAITDYASLRLEFSPTTSGGGAGRGWRLYWAEMEIPPGAPQVQGATNLNAPVTLSTSATVVPPPAASTLTDDFAVQNTTKWTFSGGNVSGGRLNFPAPPANHFDYITSNVRYSLAGSSVYVEVPAITSGGISGVSSLKIELDGQNALELLTDGSGSVLTFKSFAGGVTNDTTLPYDPVAHRWFRLREAAGTVYWETSPDSTTWTVRRSLANPFPLSSVLILLAAGFYSAADNGVVTGTAQFDNLNVPAVTGRQAPEDIPGLALRFRADSLALADGAAVPSWTSLVGTSTATQADPAKQPIYRASSTGGRPAVEFDGSADSLMLGGDALTLSRNVAGLTTYVVYQQTGTVTVSRTPVGLSVGGNAGAHRMNFGTNGATSNFRVGGRTLDTDNYDSQTGNVPEASGPMVLTAAHDYAGAVATLYANGTQRVQDATFQAPSAGNTSDTNSASAGIGAGASGIEYAQGPISEVLIWNRLHTATERAHVHSYIQDRYGITVVDYVAGAVVTHQGAANLNAPAALSGAAVRTTTAAASLNAPATLAASVVRNTSGAAALNAPAILGAGATVTRSASASLLAPAVLSAAAVRSASGAAALNAPAALAGAAITTRHGAAALNAPAGLTTSAVRTTAAASGLNAPVNLTAGPTATAGTRTVVAELWQGGAFIANLGSFNFATEQILDIPFDHTLVNSDGEDVELRLTGKFDVGAIAWDARVIPNVIQIHSGVANLLAPVALTTTPVRVQTAAAALLAPASLTAAATRVQSAAADLIAPATLTAAAIRTTSAVVNLNAPAVLTAQPIRVVVGAASLDAPAHLVSALVRSSAAVADLHAPATLTSQPIRDTTTAASLLAPVSLSAAAVRATAAATSLFAPAALSTAPVRTTSGATTLNAPMALAADPMVFVLHQGAATLFAPAHLTAAGTTTSVHAAVASLLAPASLTSTPVRVQAAAAQLLAPASLSTSVDRTTAGVAQLFAPVALIAAHTRITSGVAVLSAPVSLLAAGARTTAGVVQLLAPAHLTAAGTVVRDAVAELSAPAVLTVSLTVGSAGQVDLLAPASLTAAQYLQISLATALLAPVSMDAALGRETAAVAELSAPAHLAASGTVVRAAAVLLLAPAALTAAADRTISLAANLLAPVALASAAVVETISSASASLNAPAQITVLSTPGASIIGSASYKPVAILASTNLTGTVAALTDDPATPDGSWLTRTTANLSTSVRVSMPDPPAALSGIQTFRVLVRKTAQSTNPTALVRLISGGSTIATVVTSTTISSTTGVVLTGTWTPTGVDPATLEIEVVGTVGGGTTANRASVEVGAIAWDAAWSQVGPGWTITTFPTVNLLAPAALGTGPTRTAVAAANLLAPVQLATTASRETYVAASLLAPVALAAGVDRTASLAAALLAPVTLTSTATRVLPMAAALTAPAALTVDTSGSTTVTANLLAPVALSAAGTVVRSAAASLSAPAALTVTAVRQAVTTAVLLLPVHLGSTIAGSGVGAASLTAPLTMTVAAARHTYVAATLLAPATLTVAAHRTTTLASDLTAPATLVTQTILERLAEVRLDAPADLLATGYSVLAAAVELLAAAQMLADGQPYTGVQNYRDITLVFAGPVARLMQSFGPVARDTAAAGPGTRPLAHIGAGTASRVASGPTTTRILAGPAT